MTGAPFSLYERLENRGFVTVFSFLDPEPLAQLNGAALVCEIKAGLRGQRHNCGRFVMRLFSDIRTIIDRGKSAR